MPQISEEAIYPFAWIPIFCETTLKNDIDLLVGKQSIITRYHDYQQKIRKFEWENMREDIRKTPTCENNTYTPILKYLHRNAFGTSRV